MEPFAFSSGGAAIEAHIARPQRLRQRGTPAVILCHGFPDAAAGAGAAAKSYPDLATRIAQDVGLISLSFAYRGCGESKGDFSVGNWLDDVTAAVSAVREDPDVSTVWLVGFGTGGALAICAAAADPTIAGVASFGAPADFADWAGDPEQLYKHAKTIGAIKDEKFPEDFDAWAAEISAVDATEAAPDVAPRPLLVVHGTLDAMVPVFDARILADAHGDAELRIITGAEHGLRSDPRPIALLLGWLAHYS